MDLDWINEGAPWPRRTGGPHSEKIRGRGVGGDLEGLSEDWQKRYETKKLWVSATQGGKSTRRENLIDWFVNRKLKEAGLKPGPDASPRELYRRCPST